MCMMPRQTNDSYTLSPLSDLKTEASRSQGSLKNVPCYCEDITVNTAKITENFSPMSPQFLLQWNDEIVKVNKESIVTE